MKGKFPVVKLIGIIVCVIGIALTVVGAIFSNKKYSITPSDARNAVVWISGSLNIDECKIKGSWSGTGWAIGTPGSRVRYIITNGHVIEPGYAWPKGEDDPFDIEAKTGMSVEQYFQKKYGKSYSEVNIRHELRVNFSKDDYVVPEVVYYSGPSEKDIAILKLDDPTDMRKALLIRNSDGVDVGEEVTALGFPGVADKVADQSTVNHDVEDVTVTKGIISKRVRPSGRDYDAFQMDVAINSGNSGGPLVDKDGYVVGVNTLGNAADNNMNYAIVSKEVMDILDSENISYATEYKQISPLISLLVIGIVLILGSAVLIFVPFGRKKTPVVAPVAQPGVNPYAAAQQPRQPAAQGYPQQGYAQKAYSGQPAAGTATAAATAAATATAAAAQAGRPVATQGTRPVLKGLKGQFVGKAFDLSRGAVVLGRDPATCNLVFNKDTPGISGKHCQLNYDAASASFILTDLGSSYGTYTGAGKKLVPNAPERLAAGDIFYLADENVKFQITKE